MRLTDTRSDGVAATSTLCRTVKNQKHNVKLQEQSASEEIIRA